MDRRDKKRNTGTDREADERLIHSLLLHIHDNQAASHSKQRVQQVMQTIRHSAQQDTSPLSSATGRVAACRLRFPNWARHYAQVAALILIGIGLWFFNYNPTPAMASLDDILNSLGLPGDRTYSISMKDLSDLLWQQRPENENWLASIPKPGLDNSTLYLRDGYQYLLVRQNPNKNGLIYDGYDGKQSWRVTDGRVAEIKEGLGAGGIPMPPIMADVPFCDLHQTLKRIHMDYTVEHFGQASLHIDTELLRYTRVRRNSRDVKGPETIEIWANPESGIPQCIIFDDAKIPGNQHPCRLTFELISEKPLLLDWFTPVPHVSTNQ